MVRSSQRIFSMIAILTVKLTNSNVAIRINFDLSGGNLTLVLQIPHHLATESPCLLPCIRQMPTMPLKI